MEAFSKDFLVLGKAKDPDYNLDWNMDIRLLKSWECINMNDNKPCRYTDNKPVVLNMSETI